MTTLDGLMRHDLGCQCWPHVSERDAQEAITAAAILEYRDYVRIRYRLAEVEDAVARHVRETGCEGLREANERLRSALSACGDYIVGLGLPMGSRPVWETEYHALIDLIDGLLGGKHYPWLAALAPAVAASEEVEHAAQ